MEDISEKLDKILAKLDDKADRIVVEQRFDRILEKLDDKVDKTVVYERFDKIDQRLDRHDALFADMFQAMKEGFERVDKRFERMDERFGRMDERFERMDERFERMEARSLEQDLKMEDWRSDCRVFVEGFRDNQERIINVETRVDSLESKAS